MKRILIIGATSAIAEATARVFAARGDALVLAGRDTQQLSRIADDLKIRGAAQANTLELDANDFAKHESAIQQATDHLGGLDIALIAHGTLSNQSDCEKDFSLALKELNSNAISVMSLLTVLANRMQAQKSGQLAVIGSVAGDRGRPSNYVYGTAKAAVATFCEGLRARLYSHNVNVLLIKPGFVDTPMTAAFKKGPLWAKPDLIAKLIVRALDRRAAIIYTPSFWALIMLIIRSIPRPIFVRLKL
ncbi:SDR family oxidoreductase [Stenotrophobium rhamnosiphilum]|uniref:Short-chain dehydrogenase n=1 Tax=Stenotrophobium rhamnosiphilum TaxID=2029166 RepID=A0A2T5MHG7_9GAMM|nr:SDR family oxidoreductase [Stenotrophobium rhamnosiphilum]PTU31989.1 short-chain dehydrogenase [Stenotrophobium rhamnosiphilum]